MNDSSNNTSIQQTMQQQQYSPQTKFPDMDKHWMCNSAQGNNSNDNVKKSLVDTDDKDDSDKHNVVAAWMFAIDFSFAHQEAPWHDVFGAVRTHHPEGYALLLHSISSSASFVLDDLPSDLQQFDAQQPDNVVNHHTPQFRQAAPEIFEWLLEPCLPKPATKLFDIILPLPSSLVSKMSILDQIPFFRAIFADCRILVQALVCNPTFQTVLHAKLLNLQENPTLESTNGNPIYSTRENYYYALHLALAFSSSKEMFCLLFGMFRRWLPPESIGMEQTENESFLHVLAKLNATLSLTWMVELLEMTNTDLLFLFSTSTRTFANSVLHCAIQYKSFAFAELLLTLARGSLVLAVLGKRNADNVTCLEAMVKSKNKQLVCLAYSLATRASADVIGTRQETRPLPFFTGHLTPVVLLSMMNMLPPHQVWAREWVRVMAWLGIATDQKQTHPEYKALFTRRPHVVDGRYVVDGRKGQRSGTFGDVRSCLVRDNRTFQTLEEQRLFYRTEHHFHRPLKMAVKVSHCKTSSAFVHEYNLLSFLNAKGCPNIPRVHELFFNISGHLCISMEWLGKFTLHQWIQQKRSGMFFHMTPLEKQEWIVHLAHQILQVLVFLESHGCIHADLKPSNIMVFGSFHRTARVVDFGASIPQLEQHVLFCPPAMCHPSDVFAAFNYTSIYWRAPELLWELANTHSTAMDMWSFGCILVEAWTGRYLFAGRTEADMRQKITNMLGPISPSLTATFQTPASKAKIAPVHCHSWPPLCPTLQPECEDMPAMLKDLLNQIFVYDPRKRLRASDAIRHPLFFALEKN